jgi:hypothetical protein
MSTNPSVMISIIKQIQSSITSEAVDKLDRYEEMQCDGNKIEYIQDKAQAALQTKT